MVTAAAQVAVVARAKSLTWELVHALDMAKKKKKNNQHSGEESPLQLYPPPPTLLTDLWFSIHSFLSY